MSGLVYHYTDTARLPWILRDGELRAGRNLIGGFPNPDFLWASTLPIPDGTASSAGKASLAELRNGNTQTVRFTLRDKDFQAWPEIITDFPAWTPSEVRRLERAARSGSNPRNWRCRAGSLPRTAWLAVEARGWSDVVWAPIDIHQELIDLGVPDGECLGVWIGRMAYCSGKTAQPNGANSYSVFRMEREVA